MTEAQPPDSNDADSPEQFRSDRRKLEARIRALEAEAADEKARLQRLQSRKAVRLALRIADRAEPALRWLRRVRGRDADGGRQPDAADVLEQVRRLREDPGPAEGPSVTVLIGADDGANIEGTRAALDRATTYRSTDVVQASDSELERAEGRYTLLLQAGVRPVEDGWLGKLVTTLEDNPQYGAVSPLVLNHQTSPTRGRRRPSITIEHAGIGFRLARDGRHDAAYPTPTRLLAGGDPTGEQLIATVSIPAATSDCLLVRTEVLHQLGGLDQRYLTGLGGVDLSLQIKRLGLGIGLVGSAAVLLEDTGAQIASQKQRRRIASEADTRHFIERWGSQLSKDLAVELMTPEGGTLTGSRETKVAITITHSNPDASWADLFIARELAEALDARGFTVMLAEERSDRWYDLPDDLSVVISQHRGFDVRRAPSAALRIAWIHGETDEWTTQPWFGSYDVHMPGSSRSAELVDEAGAVATQPVPLATNPSRFAPRPRDPVYANDIAVTGNYRKQARHAIEKLIVRSGERFSIYGRGWEGVPQLSRYTRGLLPYETLPVVYSSTKVIVDDASAEGRSEGALSPTVFNALASGALVITNNRLGSTEVFADALPVYSNETDQRELLDTYLADEAGREALVGALRESVMERHTYDRRALEIPQTAAELLQRTRVAIKIGTPNAVAGSSWGDTHYAEALATALRAVGTVPSVQYRDEWDALPSHSVDVVVHVRGRGTYVPKQSHLNILWLISHPDEITPEECNGYDMVLVASELFADQLRSHVKVPVETMHQATSFRPAHHERDRGNELLFVGNSRGEDRRAVAAALAIGAPLRIYGQGWEGLVPESTHVADHAPNEMLNELYATAMATLNDHWPDMAKEGFVSNRVFDIIASGGLVFTDPVAGMDELFGGLVPTFESPEDLRELLNELNRDPESFASRMDQARAIVEREHTFAARARRLAQIIDELS